MRIHGVHEAALDPRRARSRAAVPPRPLSVLSARRRAEHRRRALKKSALEERIFLLLFKRYAEERGALAVGAASAENKARVGALFENFKLLALHAGGYVARLHGLDRHGRDLVGCEAVEERADIGDVIHMAAYINT